jgi:hypothetical protein
MPSGKGSIQEPRRAIDCYIWTDIEGRQARPPIELGRHDMDTGGISWGLQTIIGATILAAVLLWALIRNRRSRSNIDRTEQATRDLYKREEADRDDEDDKVP